MQSLRKPGKIYLLLLQLVLVLVLAACTRSSSSGSGGGSTGGEVTDGETFEFSYMLVTRFKNWLEELNWFDELQKRTNTKVTVIDGGEGDRYYNNVDLRVGGGDFPDSGMVSLAQAEVYGSQGAFVDLKPYIEKYAPNIKKYIDEHPDYKKLITASDGKIYGLIAEYPRIASIMFYREDMFKKAGVTQPPRTIEELTDGFRKIKAHYGKNDKNFYPFLGRESFIKFTEVFDAGDKIVDGKVHGIYQSGYSFVNGFGFDLYSEGFKKLITWYHQLYQEGLIDPEWIAGTVTENAWETKMLTGKGAFSYDFFTRPAFFMNNGGPENDPDYNIKALPYLLDLNGNQSVVPTSPKYELSRVMVINAKAEDKAPGIIKFLDYLWSEEGQTLIGWGVEGVTYKETNGKKEFIVSFEEEVYKPAGQKRWSFLQDRMTFPMPVNNEAFYQWNTEIVKEIASELFTDKYIKSYPILKYSTEQLRERTELLAKVEEAVLGNLVKFINGSRPMSEWDAFLNEMEQIGYKRIVEIDQQAYDAMNN